MISVDRVVIAIHNLPESEEMKNAVREALTSLPCLGVSPDWVFFCFPTYSGQNSTKIQVFLEARDHDGIDRLLQNMIEATISSALEPFVGGVRPKIEMKPCSMVPEYSCPGLHR
jgi:hypothetical protein